MFKQFVIVCKNCNSTNIQIDGSTLTCLSCEAVETEKEISRTFWLCCGGVPLELSKRCPVCNDKYEE